MTDKFHKLLQELEDEYTRLWEKLHGDDIIAHMSTHDGYNTDSLLDCLSKDPDVCLRAAATVGQLLEPGDEDSADELHLPGSPDDVRRCSQASIRSDAHAFEQRLNSTFVKGTALRDIEKIKAAMRRSPTMARPSLIAEELYWDTGCAQRIARNRTFELVTLTVILANALWMWVDVDLNTPGSGAYDLFPDDKRWVFRLADNLFCVYFTFELLVVWLSYRRKGNAFKSGWFVFNTCLLVQMIFETWIMTLISVATDSQNGSAISPMENLRILRLIRLTRLFRLTAFMRAMPELFFMVKGILKATRSVGITLGMLIGILYVGAITVRQLSDDTEMGITYFPSVHGAVFTLLFHGALLDNVSFVMTAVLRESAACGIILMLVILLTSLTLMNMLVGVLCEVMSNVARGERDKFATAFVTNKVQTILNESGLDENNDGLISIDEFQTLLSNAEAVEALRDVDVDPTTLVDFADYIFQSDETGQAFENHLNLANFMDLVMKLRGNNLATVRDMVDLRRLIKDEQTKNKLTFSRMEERLRCAVEDRQKLEHKLDVMANDASRDPSRNCSVRSGRTR